MVDAVLSAAEVPRPTAVEALGPPSPSFMRLPAHDAHSADGLFGTTPVALVGRLDEDAQSSV